MRLVWLGLAAAVAVHPALDYLAPVVGAAVRAGVVILVQLATLRADRQAGNLDLVMHAPVALARIRLAFLW